jgi:hypothetical protein
MFNIQYSMFKEKEKQGIEFKAHKLPKIEKHSFGGVLLFYKEVCYFGIVRQSTHHSPFTSPALPFRGWGRALASTKSLRPQS